MGTEKIDMMQSVQIQQLRDDIIELKTKLNTIVADVLAITTKANAVINDMNDMNDIVMAGYTIPASTKIYGILEHMDIYKDQFLDHEMEPAGTWTSVFGVWQLNPTSPAGRWYSHPRAYLAGSFAGGASGGYSYNPPAVGGTGQGTNSPHTAAAQDANVKGEYTDGKKGMLTIKSSSLSRAKKLSRQTLNSLRK